MATPTDRFSENVPGAWYVDTNCISCGLCDDALPVVFRRSDEGDHNFVHRQPASLEELEAADEARESCPVDAIGNDGQRVNAAGL